MTIDSQQFYVYPVYFDIDRNRSQGRRLGKDYCIKEPTIQKIFDKVSEMPLMKGLSTVNKSHPCDFLNKGCLLVNKDDIMSKYQILKQIGKELNK